MFKIVHLIILGPCMDYSHSLPEKSAGVASGVVPETAAGGRGDPEMVSCSTIEFLWPDNTWDKRMEGTS